MKVDGQFPLRILINLNLHLRYLVIFLPTFSFKDHNCVQHLPYFVGGKKTGIRLGMKQGRIHGNPVADGWAGALMRTMLGIQKT